MPRSCLRQNLPSSRSAAQRKSIMKLLQGMSRRFQRNFSRNESQMQQMQVRVIHACGRSRRARSSSGITPRGGSSSRTVRWSRTAAARDTSRAKSPSVLHSCSRTTLKSPSVFSAGKPRPTEWRECLFCQVCTLLRSAKTQITHPCAGHWG